MRGLIRLTRWQEHIPFTIPATLLGVNLAGTDQGSLDHRVLIVLAANILAVAFAFMVNDLEDAPDDAVDAVRAAHNPVTCGEVPRRAGWIAACGIGLAALGLYIWLPPVGVATGGTIVGLGFLYSWRGVRLKAYPVIDVVSHALMLSALLLLVAYVTYDPTPGVAWWVVIGAGLVSAYGQLYNQVRDDVLDRAAGLHNSTAVIGVAAARRVMIGCLIAAGGCLGLTAWVGLWPRWVIGLMIAVMPLLFVRRARTDMRGTAALDLIGQLQLRFFVLATGVLGVWSGWLVF